MCHIFITCLSVNGQVGSFQFLAVMNTGSNEHGEAKYLCSKEIDLWEYARE